MPQTVTLGHMHLQLGRVCQAVRVHLCMACLATCVDDRAPCSFTKMRLWPFHVANVCCAAVCTGIMLLQTLLDIALCRKAAHLNFLGHMLACSRFIFWLMLQQGLV